MVPDPAPMERITPISFWRSKTAIESVVSRPIAPDRRHHGGGQLEDQVKDQHIVGDFLLLFDLVGERGGNAAIQQGP